MQILMLTTVYKKTPHNHDRHDCAASFLLKPFPQINSALPAYAVKAPAESSNTGNENNKFRISLDIIPTIPFILCLSEQGGAST